MNDQQKKYLSDIIRAIELVDSFLVDTVSFESYLEDLKTQSAVERQLSIIGEAVNRFRRITDEQILSDTPLIVGFRNRLIHNYDGIDEAVVWAVTQVHLPKLKTEVTRLLTV